MNDQSVCLVCVWVADSEQLLTAFISHYEHRCGRTGSFGIEHLQWHQVLSVRLQIMDLMTLQEEEEEEEEREWKTNRK